MLFILLCQHVLLAGFTYRITKQCIRCCIGATFAPSCCKLYAINIVCRCCSVVLFMYFIQLINIKHWDKQVMVSDAYNCCKSARSILHFTTTHVITSSLSSMTTYLNLLVLGSILPSLSVVKQATFSHLYSRKI